MAYGEKSMKKQKRDPGLQSLPVKNPVAKFAHQFNKSQVFADKRRYQRQAKHRGLEPFAIASVEAIANGLATSGRVFQGFQAQ
jgi:hypothetical protein